MRDTCSKCGRRGVRYLVFSLERDQGILDLSNLRICIACSPDWLTAMENWLEKPITDVPCIVKERRNLKEGPNSNE